MWPELPLVLLLTNRPCCRPAHPLSFIAGISIWFSSFHDLRILWALMTCILPTTLSDVSSSSSTRSNLEISRRATFYRPLDMPTMSFERAMSGVVVLTVQSTLGITRGHATSNEQMTPVLLLLPW
ncbi:unnamed protein product [Arabis nemorensis]|uniref:Uncharacterized protein n=1 Tax=Arabis nemorensis TaxID=586526 RepID=A0A565BTB0_9BRAS|nr:unnamed protein product [Arabis nemorensis]